MGLVYFALFLLSLILLVLLVKLFNIEFVSLSPFSSSSLPQVGGQGLIDSICHSVYWHSALNDDTIPGGPGSPGRLCPAGSC